VEIYLLQSEFRTRDFAPAPDEACGAEGAGGCGVSRANGGETGKTAVRLLSHIERGWLDT